MSDLQEEIMSQDESVVRLGEAITELGKFEFAIQTLEDQLRWRRENIQALEEEIKHLRQRLGLLCASTHEGQATEQASRHSNHLYTPCKRDRGA
ncbi:hypothetical protein HORIV_34890 [Vreelandella olivaria]|uniref:Uncharacterized protein n=1 Tax=Vreelandella olivaria TaxID=390919 RepID=A0ABM7GK62_9GAMM|nr:hypothetical protein HORIV_34890 [Halomonas olivaria]